MCNTRTYLQLQTYNSIYQYSQYPNIIMSEEGLERRLEVNLTQQFAHRDERINKDLEEIKAQLLNLEERINQISICKSDDKQPSTSRSPTCSQENRNQQSLQELTPLVVNRVTFTERKITRVPRAEDGTSSKGFTYKITSSKKLPSETDEPKEEQVVNLEPTTSGTISEPEVVVTRSPEIITSNNEHTHCGGPTEKIDLIIEYKGGEIVAKASKTMTNRKLYANVRNKLGMSPDEKLHIAMFEHRVISEDDKTLWQDQLRNKPNHLVILPEEINMGDLIKIKYVTKGRNVNSNYVSPIVRCRENRS